jgi:hypothetical protein
MRSSPCPPSECLRGFRYVSPSVSLSLPECPADLPAFLAATRPRVPNPPHHFATPIGVRAVDRDPANDDRVQGHAA